MSRARFDDLTPGSEHGFELEGLVDVVTAAAPGEVVPALQAVEAATRRGLWAGGYVAYEAAPAFDPALTVLPGGDDLPLVWFGLFREMHREHGLPPRRLLPAPYNISSWRTAVDEDEYAGAIGSIRDLIAAGETYQVNHTFRLSAAFSGDAEALYRDLIHAQRGAFGAYLDMGRHQVVSASPELFFSRQRDKVEVRPMKGTIRRGRWSAEDELLAAELATSEKDRAENLMIVDLLRNDLGRIATIGSVSVDELFALERYETVWQLTSKISAAVGPDIGLSELFGALFPSGSVTGAPKARTMEIITGLEDRPRGVYCGAVGYVAPHGATDRRAAFNVAIRTVVIDSAEGTAEYGVGGGITWDSLSSSEYAEARAKAQLLVERRPEFALIETMRWCPDAGWFLRDLHLERLAASAAYFGYACDVDAITTRLDDAVSGSDKASRVRLVLQRDGTVDVTADPLASSFAATPREATDHLTFAVSASPIAADHTFLFHKTTLRGVYDDRLKLHPRTDDVLLVNEADEITEFSIGNVVVRFGDNWVTPPLDSGCLPGVMRAALLADGEIVERIVTRDDLDGASEVWFINSVRGWRRALEWEAAGGGITATVCNSRAGAR